MSAEIAECQDGYYKQSAQCIQCSNNCAPNTNCNKLTGKCDGKHDFICFLRRKSAMALGGNDEEIISAGVVIVYI